MAYFGKNILRNAVRQPRFCGTVAGILLGLATSMGIYHALNELHVKPRVAKVELNRHISDALGEIAYVFYDPTKQRVSGYWTNVRFYKLSPDGVLKKLQDTKRSVDRRRSFLAQHGYSLPEKELGLAIKNAERYVADWPRNAQEWYAYLYAGDAKALSESRPPKGYAKEIQSFYESAENIRNELTDTGEFDRDIFSSVSGLAATLLTWLYYPRIHRSLRNRYKRLISEEHLKEKVVALRKAFGD